MLFANSQSLRLRVVKSFLPEQFWLYPFPVCTYSIEGYTEMYTELQNSATLDFARHILYSDPSFFATACQPNSMKCFF